MVELIRREKQLHFNMTIISDVPLIPSRINKTQTRGILLETHSADGSRTIRSSADVQSPSVQLISTQEPLSSSTASSRSAVIGGDFLTHPDAVSGSALSVAS